MPWWGWVLVGLGVYIAVSVTIAVWFTKKLFKELDK